MLKDDNKVTKPGVNQSRDQSAVKSRVRPPRVVGQPMRPQGSKEPEDHYNEGNGCSHRLPDVAEGEHGEEEGSAGEGEVECPEESGHDPAGTG